MPGVRGSGRSRLDQGRRRQDRLHRARVTLGERILRELHARFRDEFLNGEVFYSLREAQILIEQLRKHYNTKRPHSALGYRPPAPEAIFPMDPRPVMH